MTYNIEKVERLRKVVSGLTPASRKAEFGQYFTAAPIARFMASLFSPEMPASITMLDAGAGNGILTAAFLDRWFSENSAGGSIRLTAFELDSGVYGHLCQVLDGYCSRAADEQRTITTELHNEDFIGAATRMLRDDSFEGFTHAILNPPYKKIGADSAERFLLEEVGIETVNLYSAFVALAILLLKPHGELVAIIPRSFCNGPYYRSFRKLLLTQMSVCQVHLFEARNKAFGSDGVLQENVVLYLRKSPALSKLQISTSTDGFFSDFRVREVELREVIREDDPDMIIHIPNTTPGERQPLRDAAVYTLKDLQLQISTGPIVDFRLREYLRDTLVTGSAPLLYPGHLANGRLRYPLTKGSKANAIAVTVETQKWLFPNGCYVLVRRFSSKEERKRVVAGVVLPNELPGMLLGIENHLNVFHCNRNGLAIDLAWGLAGYLNSTRVDEYFREFSGHTQVNASDLRFLPYPSASTLKQLGQEFQAISRFDQDSVDTLVNMYL